MSLTKRNLLLMVLLMFIFTQSGCALLQLPVMIVGETFSLIGKILGIVDKLPKPPPGVFF